VASFAGCFEEVGDLSFGQEVFRPIIDSVYWAMSRRASPHGGFLFHAVTLTVEIARVLVRFNYIASAIVNEDHGIQSNVCSGGVRQSSAALPAKKFRDLVIGSNRVRCLSR
jgi:hypothetical protein